MEDKKNETTNTPSTDDTTPKVTGIGGIFFFWIIPKKRINGIVRTWDLKPMSMVRLLNLEMQINLKKLILSNGALSRKAVHILRHLKKSL